MNYPYFFVPVELREHTSISLDEATSKHIGQVLRMKEGDKITLTDGAGVKAQSCIKHVHKKECIVDVLETIVEPPPQFTITIAISLLKNTTRFEWFLEKATELGVAEIVPLLCNRTEKERVRMDRLQSICVSAMLQSQQCRLPILHEPKSFSQYTCADQNGSLFIAHCMPTNKQSLVETLTTAQPQRTLLIGPEGDFTQDEILAALKKNYIPVSLGNTRLRTETAGVIGATLLTML